MSEDVRLLQGDCLQRMAEMPEASIDAVVTDPPYGLSFLGKAWDHGVPGIPFWQAALRVAKPGAHMVAFGGTRTSHRLICAIEDAGWEIRDSLIWLYGQGMPKGQDIGKAMDRMVGAEREVLETRRVAANRPFVEDQSGNKNYRFAGNMDRTAPSTDLARCWDGWNTQLKPAWEPITLCRKPFPSSVAANVAEHGCGALNIGATRLGGDGWVRPGGSGLKRHGFGNTITTEPYGIGESYSSTQGRWPANAILQHSESCNGICSDDCPVALLDAQAGERPGDRPGRTPRIKAKEKFGWSGPASMDYQTEGFTDSGSASRFFYCSKASPSDRNGTSHPCVKPTDLMRWLVRLITPPGGVVLDPFMGSGSTGIACGFEGMKFIGIDLDPDHVEDARRRIREGLRPVSRLDAKPAYEPLPGQLSLFEGVAP